MKRSIVVFLLLYFIASTANAGPITIADLIENSKVYDQKQVQLEGEVIGDIMVRGEIAWVNIADDSGALGLVVPVHLIKQLTPGRYSQRGSIVAVVGTFSRSCPKHGGDMDIHVTELRVIKEPVFDAIAIVWNRYRIVATLLFIWLSLIIWPRVRKRERA